MKSILHEKDGTCYLCMKKHHYHDKYGYTEEHHIFGGNPGRRLSEKYGLKVYLCLAHHREGPEAVHRNSASSLILKMDAQEKFEETHSREEFIKIFGKNWLEEDPMEEWPDAGARRDGESGEPEEKRAAGFRYLPESEALEGVGSPYLMIDKEAAARKLDSERFRALIGIVEMLGTEENKR